MKYLDEIVELLLVIGGLEVGIATVFKYDLLESIFGYDSPIIFFIYTVIGIAACVRIFRFFQERRRKRR
ncbi:MAG TPA: DUF378 domain-containing protein [Rhabdochlamydiaceae bacterium]|nr:DUF378 domain-containing protein [Rhabdochlamydiaceae bacterium]